MLNPHNWKHEVDLARSARKAVRRAKKTAGRFRASVRRVRTVRRALKVDTWDSVRMFRRMDAWNEDRIAWEGFEVREPRVIAMRLKAIREVG